MLQAELYTEWNQKTIVVAYVQFEFCRLCLFDWFCLVSDLSKCLVSDLSKCQNVLFQICQNAFHPDEVSQSGQSTQRPPVQAVGQQGSDPLCVSDYLHMGTSTCHMHECVCVCVCVCE